MRFAGHCWRSKEELAGDYYSGSQHMDISREDARKKTYIEQLMDDTGRRIKDLPIAMEDRERWRERVMEYRTSST